MTRWSDEMTRRIASEITRQRGDTPGAHIADKTKELGHPVSRTALWELENGKRKNITVAELLILADALDVPPAQLLFPELPDGVVRALPNTPMTSFDAVRWVSGEGDLPTRPWEVVPVDGDAPEELPARRLYTQARGQLQFRVNPNTELLELCRRYAELNQRTTSRMIDIAFGNSSTPDDLPDQLDALTKEHDAQARLLEQLIVRAGGKLGVGDGLGGEEP